MVEFNFGEIFKEVVRLYELCAFNFLNLLDPILAQFFAFNILQAHCKTQVWFHVHITYFQMF
jgi:hypothetical protein